MEKNNYLFLLFFKLFLKQNYSMINDIKLKLDFFIKSFYKNEEFNITSYFSELNNSLLYKFNKELDRLSFLQKMLISFYIKNLNSLIKRNSYFMFDCYSFSSVNKYITSYRYDKYIKQLCKLNFLYFFLYFFFVLSILYISLKLNLASSVKFSKLPNKISKLTLLRSPHIDKKSREQFELLTHKSYVRSLNLFDNNIFSLIRFKNNYSYIEYLL
ncbi:MAG: Ribosomal protein S10p/S20e [Haloplasmataceae bacterium]|jgi:small subunit ribosomal protein S10|nr:Ribosomal protein S10p/S20e [Haloplasmataceae bacterium]